MKQIPSRVEALRSAVESRSWPMVEIAVDSLEKSLSVAFRALLGAPEAQAGEGTQGLTTFWQDHLRDMGDEQYRNAFQREVEVLRAKGLMDYYQITGEARQAAHATDWDSYDACDYCKVPAGRECLFTVGSYDPHAPSHRKTPHLGRKLISQDPEKDSQVQEPVTHGTPPVPTLPHTDKQVGIGGTAQQLGKPAHAVPGTVRGKAGQTTDESTAHKPPTIKAQDGEWKYAGKPCPRSACDGGHSAVQDCNAHCPRCGKDLRSGGSLGHWTTTGVPRWCESNPKQTISEMLGYDLITHVTKAQDPAKYAAAKEQDRKDALLVEKKIKEFLSQDTEHCSHCQPGCLIKHLINCQRCDESEVVSALSCDGCMHCAHQDGSHYSCLRCDVMDGYEAMAPQIIEHYGNKQVPLLDADDVTPWEKIKPEPVPCSCGTCQIYRKSGYSGNAH